MNDTLQPFIDTQLYTDAEWQQLLDSHAAPAPVDHGTASIPDQLRDAILQGIAVDEAEVDAIAQNSAAPTFENTIVALERAGERLGRAEAVLYNLLSAETTDALEELANELSPRLTEHANNVMLNEALFRRVRAVHDAPPEGLSAEDRMLLDKTYEGFERSGATLCETDKATLRDITRQLSEQTLRFSQNVLKETNAFTLHLTDEAQLAGLPQLHHDAAQAEAKSRGLDGWVFTLHAPSYGPFMMYADSRALREQMYRAYNTRCTHENEQNNFDVVRTIVDLRRRKAQLLGYADYADYALRRRMAERRENVERLLDQLIDAYLPQARAEVSEVEERARQDEGPDFQLMPWDFAYYSQKIKHERYDYDPDMLRPYFELSAVRRGVFGLAERLYGITFSHDAEAPVYHPDVEAYRVREADGTYLGLLYLDFFPRESKKGGAWMTNYREEHCAAPTAQPATAANSLRPVVSVTTNFTKPTDTKPALLTLGEVETFLHEFGHSLHGLFAMTHYASLSGTNVYWDFVELPSQFMENFAVEPEFLSTFAFHYETGEPLPAEYVERIRRSRTFQAAYACMRQVSFGLLDMAFYTQNEAFTADVAAFEREAWSRVQLLPAVPEACMAVQFGHIMSGGYAAGYYSYKWAEVLDADAFALFKERGIFDQATARSFRQNVLCQGGTVAPMQLYRAFRGAEPTIDALLRRDGIKQA